MSIPTWWLVVSGLYFATNIVVLALVAFGLVRAQQQMREMQPKLNALLANVDSISKRVDGIAQNVQETSHSVRSTVEGVTGRANAFASKTDSLTTAAGNYLQKAAPLLSVAFALYKIYHQFRSVRGSSGPSEPNPSLVAVNDRKEG